MPLYYFCCTVCKEPDRRILEPDQLKGLTCRKPSKDDPTKLCGGKLKRYPSPPSLHFKNRIDNGLMAKTLENFDDAQQLGHDRSHADLTRPDWLPKGEE